MDLDHGLLEMIDEYVSEALTATGTSHASRQTQPFTRLPASEPEDLEPHTEPFAANWCAYDELEIVVDEEEADAALLAQVSQQLAFSESAIEPLPRSRAPRSTMDLEDEITNIVARPDSART